MLAVYTIEQNETWDDIVRTFEKYDVYWLSGYVKAFQLHGDGEPLLFYYEEEHIRGINVVMKRDIAKNENFVGKLQRDFYFDFSTPYGYGGWLIEKKDNDIIETDETERLFNEYRKWIKENGIVSEFVRFHPLNKNHDICKEFYEIVPLGEVVHMDITCRKGIWENIISKNKNMIRKAIKNDVKIYNGRFPEIYKMFKAIYDETMDKDNADKYYYFNEEFYGSLLEDLPRNAQVFWAEKNGVAISACIMLMANGYMNYHLSGSLKEFIMNAPNNLLLYEAALWGNANGYRTLFLGGGVGSGNDNLFKFKRSFNKGGINRFYIGKRIYDQQKYSELVTLSGILESNFFPKYRA